jgi:tetratricopeptide (TPR) repeat protein
MTRELGVWLVVVLGILGLGMGSMLWAYRRPLGATALFLEPLVDLSMPVQAQARSAFEAGCATFRQERYGRAIAHFTQVVDLEPQCAEAFYNCGLIYANLGNDGQAVRALVKASELYDHQGTKAGLDLVKQALGQLATRQQNLRAGLEKAGA